MRILLALVLWLGALAQAAQVTLRAGETGRLGNQQITVLAVQDDRCGPTEDCLATVMVKVRVKRGVQNAVFVLQLPQERLPRWSGVGVVAIKGKSVTLVNQPSSNRQTAQQITLLPGQSGTLGGRQLTLQGLQTRRCPPTLLCVRPVLTSVYVWVRWGQKATWLELEYPPPPKWPGLSLVAASAGASPVLTLSDQRP